MAETKIYLVHDIIIAVLLVIYYFISKGSLATTTSSGIQGFYMLEIGLGILLQVLLVIVDGMNQRKWVASLRLGAIVYIVGLFAIVVKLGLFTISFIIIFFAILTWQLILIQDVASKSEDEVPTYSYSEDYYHNAQSPFLPATNAENPSADSNLVSV
jgi:hypothetical protein